MKDIASRVGQVNLNEDNLGLGLVENLAKQDWEDIDMDEGPMHWDGDSFNWEEEIKRQLAPGPAPHPNPPPHRKDDNVEISYHPNAPKKGQKGLDLFESIDQGEDSSFRKDNPYHPFDDRRDYQLGSWLTRANLSMKEMDAFLALDFVSLNRKFSYQQP